MLHKRGFSEILPLIGALGALTLGLVCVLIGFGSLFLWIDSAEQGESSSKSQELPPMSEYAAAIATIDAAPRRTPQTRAVSQTSSSSPSDLGYDPAIVAEGQALFTATCSACHGPDAHGITGLGKDLINSEFVHSLSDADFLTFVKTGRPIWDAANTTGVDMPPRGGNPTLTDDDLLLIITFIRASSGVPAAQIASTDPTTTDASNVAVAVEPTMMPTTAPTALSPVVPATLPPAGEDTNVSLASAGQELFVGTCSACHGPDAHGITGLGKDLVKSEFLHSLTDDEFLTFVKTGRPLWDAANTTGVDMPPRGGNPALTDDQILSIIAYIRSLQNMESGS